MPKPASSIAARFGGGKAKPAAPSKAKPPRTPTSRFGGVEFAKPRNPRPQCGNFRFRFNTGGEGERVKGKKLYYVATLEVVESDHSDHPRSSLCHYDQCIENSALQVAGEELTKMAMAFNGFDPADVDHQAAWKAYELDEGGYDGAYVDAMVGDNTYGAVDKFGENPLENREAFAQVTRGGDTADGNDFYRRFRWLPADDAEG